MIEDFLFSKKKAFLTQKTKDKKKTQKLVNLQRKKLRVKNYFKKIEKDKEQSLHVTPSNDKKKPRIQR